MPNIETEKSLKLLLIKLYAGEYTNYNYENNNFLTMLPTIFFSLLLKYLIASKWEYQS